MATPARSPAAGAPAATTAAPPPPPAVKNYRRTWLILTETSDPSLSLGSLRGAYRTLLDAAAEAGAPAPRDAEAFDLIERDVARTFGGTAGLGTQPARDALRRLLAAYALLDREVGYVQSMNFLAGFIVLSFMQQPASSGGGGAGSGGGGGGGDGAAAAPAGAPPPPAQTQLPALSPDDEADAFALFARLMRGPGYDMRRFFVPGMGGVPIMSYVLSQSIKAHLPALGAHLDSVGVDPVFIMEWYLTLFTYILPPSTCAEVRRGGWGAGDGGWQAGRCALGRRRRHTQPTRPPLRPRLSTRRCGSCSLRTAGWRWSRWCWSCCATRRRT
jgi:hypothetical protein